MNVINETDALIAAHAEWSDKLDHGSSASSFPPLSDGISNSLTRLENILGRIIESKKEEASNSDTTSDSTSPNKGRGGSRKVRDAGYGISHRAIFSLLSLVPFISSSTRQQRARRRRETGRILPRVQCLGTLSSRPKAKPSM